MRNLILIFSFLACSLLAVTLFVGVQSVKEKPILKEAKAYLYDSNGSVPIEHIHMTIFYVVPKDSVNKKIDSWKEITNEHVQNLLSFHSTQFGNTSKITYDFFPQIIIGEKTAIDYESLLDHSDHDALKPLQEELNRRVLQAGGDLSTLYQKNKTDPSARNVYLIVFEGNGAAGNGDFALISRSYLTDITYKETGSTFLAHEFYHTLGIPDMYETSVYVFKDGQQAPVSILTSKDIMGQVNIPLQYTYIKTETLKKMGL
jgi:hypothetical protein